jgi:para-nitrobenzyl esterase
MMTDLNSRVATTSGTVEGFSRDQVTKWRSIPYALPAAGPLRFRGPRPPQPWRGVRRCHEFAFCAHQDRKYTLTGVNKYQPMSEDCLTVNVVAPSGAPPAPLPVLFFVHGGGYMLGSTSTPLYDGAALARRGCVYVSANYRLGALGCLDLSSLSTPDITIESNLFLRDLVLALQWVRDNIAGFGGDPDRVTIFGESAGAHAVASLLAVPAAQGLFHGAISESPPSGLINSAETAAEFASRFVSALGAGEQDAASVLLSAPPRRLVDTLAGLMAASIRDTPGLFNIGATVDGDYLPRDPIDAMARGQAHRVPLIIGNNAEESRLFSRFMNYLPTSEPVIERLFADMEPAVRTRIKAAYPRYPHAEACRQLGSDFAFGSFSWQIAEAHSRHAPTYLYRYDFAPRTLTWAGLGATHATELLAVFDVYRTRIGGLLTLAGDRRPALRVSNNVQRRWRVFGATGVPGDDWPAYAEPGRAVMVFDRHSRVEFDPTPRRREAWQAFSFSR